MSWPLRVKALTLALLTDPRLPRRQQTPLVIVQRLVVICADECAVRRFCSLRAWCNVVPGKGVCSRVSPAVVKWRMGARSVRLALSVQDCGWRCKRVRSFFGCTD